MKRVLQFRVALEPRDEHRAYGVVVPDLPGCFSAGDTVDEALANAGEAILMHVEGLVLRGEPVPVPRPIAERARDRRYKGWIWAVVPVDLAQLEGPAERVNLTIPRRYLRRIDAAARVAGESRSAFMVRAAIARATPPTRKRQGEPPVKTGR
jgi:predicted RNase H-like HicB family nuclease